VTLNRYLAIYTFHKINPLSIHRLLLLKNQNPNAIIIPTLGISPTVYFPTLIRPRGWFLDSVALFPFQSHNLFQLNHAINRKVEFFHRRQEIESLRVFLHKHGFNLNCDFTPLGYFYQDLAILNWFLAEGRTYRFDYLVYFEYDMLSTLPIEKLYEKYAKYDAAFIYFRSLESSWMWPKIPPYASRELLRWIKKHKGKNKLYGAFFPGFMIKRNALEQISRLHWPNAFCELRLPSILMGLGLSCTKLDFPMVRYRPGFTKADVEKNWNLGLFHPVYENFKISYN
jgi:hypothetical protein